MQVRKFEAKTMKEALEMVKQHLGPEAIILSAKDNSRGFGLIGERSVEVTAAVSEDTLRRKKLAEAKLRAESKEKFSLAPARVQKQFINRIHERQAAPLAPVQQQQRQLAYAGVPRPVPTQRYVDIIDEELPYPASPSSQRIKDAAQRARRASQGVLTEPKPVQRQHPAALASPTAVLAKAPEVAALEVQIGELKSMIEKFQKVPQTMLSAHPGADEGIPYELSMAFQRLKQAGVQTPLSVEWLKSAAAQMDREHLKKSPLVDAWIVQKILRETAINKDPMAGRYHVFLGTTAQGKTSTLVKVASQLVLKEKKRIALVSLDTVKVGAADQLKIYAQILNVPFATIRDPGEWPLLEGRGARRSTYSGGCAWHESEVHGGGRLVEAAASAGFKPENPFVAIRAGSR